MADIIHVVYGAIRRWVYLYQRHSALKKYKDWQDTVCTCKAPLLSTRQIKKLILANEDAVVDLLCRWYNMKNWKPFNCSICETYPNYIQHYLRQWKVERADGC